MFLYTLTYFQWRRQPDILVPLCKFPIVIIIHFFRNWLFSKSAEQINFLTAYFVYLFIYLFI